MKAFLAANWKHWVLGFAIGVLKVAESFPPLAPFHGAIDNLILFLGAGGIVALPAIASGKPKE